ncbi:MAG: RsmE family RNA methyltransferase [Planctomycetales bacterium]
MHRFYVPPPLSRGLVTLDGPEAHHLIHVLRARPGQRVGLFDGTGTEAVAGIVAVRRRTAELEVPDVRQVPPTTGPLLTIAAAVPKGERLRFLVEKLTELGVERLALLETERGVVEPRERKVDKLRQTVIAACKQSGRSRLMQVDPPLALAEFCARELRSTDDPPPRTVIAHPGGDRLASVLHESSGDRPLIAIVGPEGGFTGSELETAIAAEARPVSLGETILRIETAALALAALTVIGTGRS